MMRAFDFVARPTKWYVWWVGFIDGSTVSFHTCLVTALRSQHMNVQYIYTYPLLCFVPFDGEKNSLIV